LSYLPQQHVSLNVSFRSLSAPLMNKTSVSKNDDGFVVGTSAWEFGTCNGRLREIVRVVAGKRYKFRLINAGHVFALRIDLGLKMTVVAADSEPVVPLDVDQVILHAAERFDVEITIPPTAKLGETFWIKADTLESTSQGYQNGIRAVLQIVDLESSDDIHDDDVQDPRTPVDSLTHVEDVVTLNCYSQNEVKSAGSNGGCLPITTLKYYSIDHEETAVMASNPAQAAEDNPSPEVHTVDFAFSPPPQFAHFVRIDNSPFLLQHTNPRGSMLHPSFDSSTDMHPHSAVLHVAAESSAIIIWRSALLVDHPIHLHGLKMEILDVIVPDRQKSCSLATCELRDELHSPEHLKSLVKKPRNQTVLKDTFILPAGGAVAVRVQTGVPNVWFAHCHLNSHKEDGMALILNVGSYRAPSDGIWLPEDYPDCETPFLRSQIPRPACECYVNEDSVLGTALTGNHRCSRDHLCHHELGQVAHLEHHMYPGGVAIRSQYMIPEWGISLLVLLSIAVITILVHCISRARSKATPTVDGEESGFGFARSETNTSSDQQEDNDGHGVVEIAVASNTCEADVCDIPDEEKSSKWGGSRLLKRDVLKHKGTVLATADGSSVNGDDPFWQQLQHIFQLEWELYRPTCVNLLRVFEVTGLALLTGILFYDVGNDATANGLAQKTSLLFFGVTLWTFTRMYPSVGSYFQWTKNNIVIFSHGRFDVIPVCLGRLLVVLSTEWFWPFLYCFVCFPMAGIAGDVTVVFKIGALLALNNLCYISIGAVLGTVCTSVPLGMIASTIISQTSLVAAGFYTTLPPVIEYIRYVSPVFWTFKGIVKASYHWSDTYKCTRGQSDVGVNQCFLEFNPGIDNLKTRGIEVATFNAISSDKTYIEFLVLVLLFSGMQLFIIARTYAQRRQKNHNKTNKNLYDQYRHAHRAEHKDALEERSHSAVAFEETS
jgi:FtsP/CotA-like multicopper oxidase with cupredoxin domain